MDCEADGDWAVGVILAGPTKLARDFGHAAAGRKILNRRVRECLVCQMGMVHVFSPGNLASSGA